MKTSMLKHVIGTRVSVASGKKQIPDYASLLKRNTTRNISSVVPTKASTTQTDCGTKQANVYTGTNMIGIATMNKSNAVPVFSKESAVDISHMRR